MYAMVIINTVINLLCPWILLNLRVCRESILDILQFVFNIVVFFLQKCVIASEIVKLCYI